MDTPPAPVHPAIAATRAIVMPEVLDTRDLAYWLRCGESTARARLRAGVIPGRRLGRRWFVTRAALLRALEAPVLGAEGRGPMFRVVREEDQP
jgi:hypothetical protein